MINWKEEDHIKVIYNGEIMSGDAGLDESIVFYSKKMTEAKMIVLKHKGIKLNYKSIKSIEKTEQVK